MLERPGLGIGHFYYVAIVLLALAAGPRAGGAGGVLAAGLFALGMFLNKHTPSIAFIPDAIPENARHIEDLLAQARAADEHVHNLAEGAVPAGEADPYRHPEQEDE